MKKLVLLFLCVFSASVFAECKLETYDRIIKINVNQDRQIIKDSDCNEDIQNTFIKFISSTTGRLNSKHLKRYFKFENGIDISISPEEFNVETVKSHIEENLNNEGIIVKRITSLLPQSSINLDKTDQIKISCKDCSEPGEKNIQAEINQKKIWLTALIHKKREAYVLAKSLISLEQKIDETFFKKVTIADTGNTLLFNDIKNIRFYRPTKLLRSGDIIKKYDLRSRVLVRFGQRVSVDVKGANIKLGSKATARRSGHIGDVIELINDKSKKVITAKVVDFDKVEVEL